jgi:hypothetical protein
MKRRNQEEEEVCVELEIGCIVSSWHVASDLRSNLAAQLLDDLRLNLGQISIVIQSIEPRDEEKKKRSYLQNHAATQNNTSNPRINIYISSHSIYP